MQVISLKFKYTLLVCGLLFSSFASANTEGFNVESKNSDGVVAIALTGECISSFKENGEIPCNRKMLYGAFDVVYSNAYNKYITCGDWGSFNYSSDGISWRETRFTDLGKIELNRIAILDDNEGYVAAVGNNGAIVASNNMGATWSLRANPAGTQDLQNIYSDGEHFFIAVDGVTWLYSDNGGFSWSKRNDIAKLPQAPQYLFSNNGEYYIVGGSDGAVYISADNMSSWVQQKSVLYKPEGKSKYATFNSYLYAKKQGLNLLLGTDNTLFVSDNSGIANDHWTRIIIPTTVANEDFTGASIDSKGDIYMVSNAPSGSNQNGSVYKSSNGYDWVKLVGYPNISFLDILAIK